MLLTNSDAINSEQAKLCRTQRVPLRLADNRRRSLARPAHPSATVPPGPGAEEDGAEGAPMRLRAVRRAATMSSPQADHQGGLAGEAGGAMQDRRWRDSSCGVSVAGF
jgi:hypothetical protein